MDESCWFWNFGDGDMSWIWIWFRHCVQKAAGSFTVASDDDVITDSGVSLANPFSLEKKKKVTDIHVCIILLTLTCSEYYFVRVNK